MKPERALLLEMTASSELSSTLQTILEPSFRLDVCVLPPPPQTAEVDEPATSGTKLDKFIRDSAPALIYLLISDGRLQEAHGLLASIKQQAPDIPLIVVIGVCQPDELFELLKVGASDFIVAPLKAAEVLPRSWRLLQQPQPQQQQQPDAEQTFVQTLKAELGLKQLIGQSAVFLAQVDKIPLVAKCAANVLIAGETGTGKELYARAIHYCSARTSRPFMPVNCGAIPVELVENELFGHQRGAFTSASTLQPGLIEEADGGTLFLDEIDCLPVMAQVKLLRFLQDKEYRPLGSTRMRRVDVRIIAASNLNLEEAVALGKVRQDLYYRLNVVSLTLPPLRERREDIPLLAHHFLDKYAGEFDKEIVAFSPDALELLIAYSWPGNVRELEHVIERAIVLSPGPVIHGSDLVTSSMQPAGGRPESLQQAKAKEIARFEKSYVQGLLSACRGNITKAAQAAQKNRRSFWQLIQKYQIDVDKFKSNIS
jgi:DNA-binding NtrC family response regulator